MPDIKTTFSALGMIAACLFTYNTAASTTGNSHTSIQTMVAQQRSKLVQSANSTLEDARSALLQARHVLLEGKNKPEVSYAEVRRLKQLVNHATLNLQRAEEIAGGIEGINSRV